jgi:hypothetical protein
LNSEQVLPEFEFRKATNERTEFIRSSDRESRTFIGGDGGIDLRREKTDEKIEDVNSKSI